MDFLSFVFSSPVQIAIADAIGEKGLRVSGLDATHSHIIISPFNFPIFHFLQLHICHINFQCLHVNYGPTKRILQSIIRTNNHKSFTAIFADKFMIQCNTRQIQIRSGLIQQNNGRIGKKACASFILCFIPEE